MSKTLITSNPDFKREKIDRSIPQLKVAEFFSRTIQGEGISAGMPAAFLRTKDCTLDCVWCDSSSVWRFGNSYSVFELLDLMEKEGVVDDFKNGHHFVLTGGSPLKQQKQFANLIALFQIRFGFIPYIEVENECMLMPDPVFAQFVSQWNNSPKLSNCGMKKAIYHKPQIIKQMSLFDNSWFKIVVANELDWQEIEEDFLKPQIIRKEQLILMPCGATQVELNTTRGFVADIAIRESVMFSDRQHVILWDQKTGV